MIKQLMELFNIYKYTYEVVLENYNKEGNEIS
jgi:hypothetical protein